MLSQAINKLEQDVRDNSNINIDQLIAEAKRLKHPWVTENKIEYHAVSFLMNVGKKILSTLTQDLNYIHSNEFDENYYHLVLGPWLMQFLAVIYDRHQLLIANKRTIEELPGSNLNFVPVDSYTALKLAETRDFNAQILSDLLTPESLVNVKQFEFLHSEKINEQLLDSGVKKTKKNNKQKILNYISKMTRNKLSIVASVNSIPIKDQLKLFFKFVNIRPIYPFKSQNKIPISGVRTDLRGLLMRNFLPNCEFEAKLKNLLPVYIPACFVENYKELDRASKSYGKSPRAIIINVEMYSRYEVFLFWAANCSMKGSKIISCQHGGNYGVDMRCEKTFIEVQPYSKFFSWGWKWKQDGPSDNGKITPLPSLHLNRINKKVKVKPKQTRYLFVLTSKRNYTRRLMGTVANVYNGEKQFNIQVRYYNSLSLNLQKKTVIRLYKDDYGRNTETLWKEKITEVKLDDIQDFNISIARSSCVVIDHISTTWLEVISQDRPLKLIIDPSHYDFTPNFENIFKKMLRAKIAHKDPELAAAHLNHLGEDLDKWWLSNEVQAVIDEIKSNVANLSKRPLEAWKTELNSL